MLFSKRSPRKRQYWGYLLAIFIALLILVILQLPGYAWLHAAGPMNSGHEKLSCEDCHQSSAGTLRQQLQANMRYLLGERKEMVAVGFRSVSNRDCIHCHKRPSDNHPVSRFLEPRFKKVRTALAPQNCNSCHREHQGRRVTSAIDICQHCHDELKVKHEKIEPTHQQLVQDKRWPTCLGCHDFHGNHKMKLVTRLNALISEKEVQAYFAGQSSPYSENKKYKALYGGQP